jgi:hypothetical protein
MIIGGIAACRVANSKAAAPTRATEIGSGGTRGGDEDEDEGSEGFGVGVGGSEVAGGSEVRSGGSGIGGKRSEIGDFGDEGGESKTGSGNTRVSEAGRGAGGYTGGGTRGDVGVSEKEIWLDAQSIRGLTRVNQM